MEDKIKFLRGLNREDIDDILGQYQILFDQYHVAKSIVKGFVDDDSDIQSGSEVVKRLTSSRIRYIVVVDIVTTLFSRHYIEFKKDRAKDKEIVEQVRKDYEENGPQETSEEDN